MDELAEIWSMSDKKGRERSQVVEKNFVNAECQTFPTLMNQYVDEIYQIRGRT